MNVIRHLVVILAALFVTLGIPALVYVDVGALFTGAVTDGVTGASLEIPDQPSGQFVILLNREKHPNTQALWADFFTDQPVDVIMEDLRCMTARGDVSGIQLANRYQARLAENQMTIRQENGTLVASRLENDLFDGIILSKEFADACQLDLENTETILVIPVKGAAQ